MTTPPQDKAVEAVALLDKALAKLAELRAEMDGAYPIIRGALGAMPMFAHTVNSKILGAWAQIVFAKEKLASSTADAERIKALEDALGLSANRMEHLSIEFSPNDGVIYYEAKEWVDEARAALTNATQDSDYCGIVQVDPKDFE